MNPDKYAWQPEVIDFGVNWFNTAIQGDRICLQSPTGTGKTYCQLGILKRLDHCIIVAPKHEIIDGYLKKLGIKNYANVDEATRYALGFATPIYLRNRLLEGLYQPPNYLMFDEAHHLLARSWMDIWALCAQVPIMGFTATAFGGTPKRTKEFREFFLGKIKTIMNYPQAAKLGLVSVPKVDIFPLIDDDLIGIRNGEFQIESVCSLTKSKLIHVGEKLYSYYNFETKRFDKSTIIAWPQTELMINATNVIKNVLKLPLEFITHKTPREERRRLFKLVVEKKIALGQINVISEGVDLPLERLIDLAPTMSPIKFLQILGRIMRPGLNNEYIMCNRNLLRFGHLLAGVLPADVMRDTQLAFPPSERMGVRVIGLEGLGKFKAVELHFVDGLIGHMYSISRLEGFERVDYCCIVHPLCINPTWAVKHSKSKNGKLDWGRWEKCKPIEELDNGFASLPPVPVSEAQMEWWLSEATNCGLDVSKEVNRKSFQALACLCQIGLKFRDTRTINMENNQ